MEENKNLNIIQENANVYNVEGVYYTNKEQLKLLKQNSDFVKEIAAYKKEFLKTDTGVETITVLNSFFVDIFINLELKEHKDLSLCSYSDIIKVLKLMVEEDKFTSTSVFLAYAKIINMYTMWAYSSNLRYDIVTVSDITREIDKYKVTCDKPVYTRNEILEIISNQRDDVKIALMGLIEGIKIKEIVKIKREDDILNNPDDILVIGERLIPVSNKLMNCMRKYANVVKVETVNNKGQHVKRALVNTDYLFRAVDWGRAKKGRDVMFNNTILINLVNEQIKEYGIKANDIRNYIMYNDIIDGISLEDFNIKYDTKYRTLNQVIRDEKTYEKLISKRIKENTYNKKCS